MGIFNKQIHSILILIGAILVPIIIIVLIYGIGFATKNPKITILEPVNNSSIQASSVVVKGKVKPVYSKILINDKEISTNDGNFEYEMKLDDTSESNNIYIKAINKDLSDGEMFTIKRIFTDEEKKKIEDDKLKKEKEELAKQKAEQVAYDKSPAGILCNKHSKWPETREWSRVDCERAVSGEVWIGMNSLLLVAKRGNPDSNNKSNYGSGNEYQFCWHDLSPSCVYVKESDVLIYSYN